MTLRVAAVLATPLLLAACGGRPILPPCEPGAETGPIAWIVDYGWHTELAIPAAQATGPLAALRTEFPGAAALSFGFGKRSFFMAPEQTSGEVLLGLFPGPGAIRVTGLRAPPGRGYAGLVVLLQLPPGGGERLSDFLWRAIEADGVRPIGRASEGGVFYAASRGYHLAYTCNTWVVDGVARAGLPVGLNVVFASGALREVARVRGACWVAPGAS